MVKLGINLSMLMVACLLTNYYLMDGSAIQSSRREENLYEIIETKPQEFLKFNSTTLKHRYRALSKKYHPDKNPDEDTTDKFMKIKTAYETLNDPEKRLSYDIYGQVEFQQDDNMKNAFEVKYKNATERETQWNNYKMAKKTMKVVSEVVPYYFTWFVLSVYRIDVSTVYFYILNYRENQAPMSFTS